MKRPHFCLLVLLLIFLSACSKKDKTYETLDAKDVFFTYPAENTRVFTVAEDGSLYCLEDQRVSVYDLNGEKIADYDLNTIGSINLICISDNTLYFTAKTYDETEHLYSYDIEAKEQKELISLDGFSSLKKIACIDGRIYIMGIHTDYMNKDYDLWEGDLGSTLPYVYDGSVLAAYQIKENHLDLVFDQLPNNFAVTPDGKIMLYAYDSEGGYYFGELDPESGAVTDKHYTEVKTVINFTVDEQGGLILFPSASKTSSFNTLSYLPLQSNSGIADIMPQVQVAFTDSIKYRKGFTFYLNSISGKIERIKNSVYVKDNPKIKMISAGNYVTDIFSAGYQVEFSELKNEEFALSVLSLDKNYDLCYMNSRQDFSMNIKNKGSFYPLNDVPFVKEYIESCFPYVKDAATDEEGSIWMLPIDVSIPILAYHEENCKKAGLDFAAVKDVYNMIEQAEKARTMDQSLFAFNGYVLQQKSIALYLRQYTTLNTEEFRKLAPALAKFYSKGVYIGNSLAISEYTNNRNPDFLFSAEDNRVYQTLDYIIGRNDLKVASLTGNSKKNSAYCIYLCVNPNSDNLKTTLEYISALCEYIMTMNNSYLLADPSKYTDSSYARELYAIYENGMVDFSVSHEVFADDFGRYLQGEIDLDTLIEKGNRKLAMYYKE